MVTFFECPECGAVRPSQKDILSHCRNMKDHTTFDFERLQLILDDQYEREFVPANPTR